MENLNSCQYEVADKLANVNIQELDALESEIKEILFLE